MSISDLSKVKKGDKVYVVYPAEIPKLVTVTAVWECGINYMINNVQKCAAKSYLYLSSDVESIIEELEGLVADCEYNLKRFKEVNI